MKIIALIQARLNASRFPDKVIKQVDNVPLVQFLNKRIEKSKNLDGIVWAIPDSDKNSKLDSFLKKDSMDLIFTDLNSDNIKVDKSKLTDKSVCIIVGPEGDFSETERDKILSFKGVQSVKINENILRSETAVISAISIVNYVIN